jgi:hypothetical protein
VLTEPICPKCGATGADLQLIGSREFPPDAVGLPPVTIYSYDCKCGMGFTFAFTESPKTPPVESD